MDIRAHLVHEEKRRNVVVLGNDDTVSLNGYNGQKIHALVRSSDVCRAVAALQEQGYRLKAASGRRIKPA